MHDTLNISDWKSFYEKYTSVYVDGMNGRFLLRNDRVNGDTIKHLNDLARAYKTAQRQNNTWRDKTLKPLFQAMEDRATDGVLRLHAKPTHGYEPYKNHDWCEYLYSKSSYGWGYSFDWVEEPIIKLNHDLGQKLYEYSRHAEKFSRREYMLKMLLKDALIQYVYKLYDSAWLDEHQFSNKIVKFSLLGDQYWYRIEHNRRGIAEWKNFIWQTNNVEEIHL